MSTDKTKIIAGQVRLKCLIEIVEEVQTDAHLCFATDRFPSQTDGDQFWDDYTSAHFLLKKAYESLCRVPTA